MPQDRFSKMLTCHAQLAVLLVIQAGVAPVTAATCYKYSGQIGNSGTDDSGDKPCDPDAPVSACCGAGSICISNLHCYDVNITTPNVPGTCTDQSFSDSACPCPPTTSLDYEDDVTFCPDGSYCCGNNNTACCRSNSGRLEIFYGNPGPIPFATASLADYYSSLKVSIKSRSTTISLPRSSTQTPTTVSASSVPTAGTSSTTSSMPAASPSIASHTSTSSTPATSAALDPSNSTGNVGLSQSAKIAVGTVLPVVAFVAGFVAWRILGRRRLSSREATPKIARHSADVQLPDFHPPRGLSSGLDRAELVTRQWDSAELPSGHLVELAARS